MFGAVVSVEPVTETLPVAPGSVHSGVPLSAGAAVGHVVAAAGVGVAAGAAVGVCVSVTENGSAGDVVDVLVDDAAESESEPHAASVVTSNVAPAASATEEDTREKFTVATLHNDEFLAPRRSIRRTRHRKVEAMGPAPRGGYLPVNGLNLYYAVYGKLGTSKPPLMLIPGAFMATDSMSAWAEAFARDRAVIVLDQQGHGRTADTSRAMSYEQFGDDTAALLRALRVERADVMGYSQGGGVALQLSIRHPSLVNKLVSMSATFRKDGWYPAVFDAIGRVTAADFAGTPVETAFRKHTPDAAASTPTSRR